MSPPITYKYGQTVRFSADFYDNTDPDLPPVLADPGTVTLRLMDPQKRVTSFTYSGGQVVKDSVGKYYYNFLPPYSGPWTYRWIGSAGVTAADESTFIVSDSMFDNV